MACTFHRPGSGAEYCDEHVCLWVFRSVRVRKHISETTRLNVTKFVCMMGQSSSDNVVAFYVLPVLSRFPIMGPVAE